MQIIKKKSVKMNDRFLWETNYFYVRKANILYYNSYYIILYYVFLKPHYFSSLIYYLLLIGQITILKPQLKQQF